MTDFTGNRAPERLHISDARDLAEQMAVKTVLKTSGPAAGIARHMCSSMGKGVRSLLLLICAADEDLFLPGKAVYMAAAIEIFHMATLVHDDIVDEAHIRRGIESIPSRFGKKSAVIIGDYLLCASLSTAIKAVDKSDLMHESYKGLYFLNKYINSFTKICLGEMDEVENNRNISLTPRRYLKIISGKTAELFRIAALIGAAFAGGDVKQDQVGRIGWYLGMVFQIIDDCKDFGFNSDARKPVKHDLTQGVVTLPLILALAKKPDMVRLVNDVFFQGRKTEGLIDAVCQAGGIDMTVNIAARYSKKAEKLIDGMFDGLKRDMMREMVHNALSASASFETLRG